MNLGGDLVTRLRAPDVAGPDGATIPGNWSTVTEPQLLKVDYPGSSFQPMSSDESIVAQQRTRSTHRAFLPAGADVLVTDRLRFDGLDYQVDGQPERWRINGIEHHLEVLVFRVSGG